MEDFPPYKIAREPVETSLIFRALYMSHFYHIYFCVCYKIDVGKHEEGLEKKSIITLSSNGLRDFKQKECGG